MAQRWLHGITVQDLEQRSARNRASWTQPVAPERVEVLVAPAPGDAPRRSKHGARKVEVGGIMFDSTKEARWYQRLLNLQAIGAVRNLRVHELLPLEVNGVRVADYEADFLYEECVDASAAVAEWRPVVADAKSPHTRTLPVYRLKRRLLLACLGVEIRELC